jgi:hypothetical protein
MAYFEREREREEKTRRGCGRCYFAAIRLNGQKIVAYYSAPVSFGENHED